VTTTEKPPQSPHSDVTTHGIRIVAKAQFLPQQSDEDRGHFVYVYRIAIENRSDRPARLLSRHWKIVDAQGRSEEVVGDGVVGEQPRLEPGEIHEYNSGCPLRTSWGTMEGTYTFADDDGERFEVAIGRFFLVPTAPPIFAD
jgi:ApaG protein